MKKRSRYQDKKSVGRSSIIPFKKDEKWDARHKRRLGANLHFKDKLGNWCKKNGVSFEVKNEGHHWLFIKGATKIDWWPSSAKVIFNQVWDEGIHCHDYKQLIKVIEKKFKGNNKSKCSTSKKKDRRGDSTNSGKARLKGWCEKRGFSLEVKNNTLHWILNSNSISIRVEWWPSTQKTVFNQNFEDCFRVRDVEQLMELIEKKIEKMVQDKGVKINKQISFGF